MNLDHLIKSALRELADLDARRSALLARIAELQKSRSGTDLPPSSTGTADIQRKKQYDDIVTGASPTRSKIALFWSLFRGRKDVFPRRFESVKTGRSGYQPACRNEKETWMMSSRIMDS